VIGLGYDEGAALLSFCAAEPTAQRWLSALALLNPPVRQERVPFNPLLELVEWIGESLATIPALFEHYIQNEPSAQLAMAHWRHDRMPLAEDVRESLAQFREQPRRTLRRIRVPSLMLAAMDDPHVRWQEVYELHRLLRGEADFVTAAGVRGTDVVESASYYVNRMPEASSRLWMDGAERRSDIWWRHLVRWANVHARGSARAPREVGSERYPPLYPAPGNYVNEAPDDYRLELPRDDAVIRDTPLQWWYWTLHLKTAEGREFGSELIFFVGNTFDGFLRGTQGHAAVTDVDAGKFQSIEFMDLGETPPVLDGHFRLSAERGSFSAYGGDGHDRLRAEVNGYLFDVHVRERVRPTIHYQGLDHRFRFGGDTRYYSRTLMDAEGYMELPSGELLKVSGSAWFDRQWGELFPSILNGWQWFAIQLDDDTQIMLFAYNRAPEEWCGSVTRRNGESHELAAGDYELDVLEHWESPRTRIRYPSRWRVRIPRHQIDIEIVPLVADQELKSPLVRSADYWEGACEVRTTGAGRSGKAYVELVGWDKR
jgi:predicted secreted hydrolase